MSVTFFDTPAQQAEIANQSHGSDSMHLGTQVQNENHHGKERE